MQEATRQLVLTVQAIYPLNDAEMEAFLSKWKLAEVKRKVLLTCKGDVEHHLYFVTEGLQRIYYADEQDREATIGFTYPYSFGGIIDSLMLQCPSHYYFETLTHSRFLKLSFKDLDDLMRHYPAIERMIRLGLARAMSGVLQRMVEVQTFSSEEKFRVLLTRSPHILQLVPHKYIANYLGIDASNFSKLLNKHRL
jgi:CRP-like cAMP-binding protein